MVLFRLGSAHWAASASEVREVIAAVRPTRIPGAGEAVAGLVNVRGTLVTVIDARRAMGLDAGQAEPESILLVERDGRTYGVLIDAVLDLVDVKPEELSDAPPPGARQGRLARASGRHQGLTFSVLDTEALLAPVVG
jgi:purine-binding chemotaxis protein CheW